MRYEIRLELSLVGEHKQRWILATTSVSDIPHKNLAMATMKFIKDVGDAEVNLHNRGIAPVCMNQDEWDVNSRREDQGV